MLNAYSGVISKLGLNRKPRDVPALHTYLAQKGDGDEA
jgi:hypothetical protein